MMVGSPGFTVRNKPTEATMKWIRTCQECGNKQQDTPPPVERKERDMDRWLAHKCYRCKSEALDYGKNDDNSDLAWAE
jgi:hypothetical protein